jgi:hypothetical protein
MYKQDSRLVQERTALWKREITKQNSLVIRKLLDRTALWKRINFRNSHLDEEYL